MDESRTGTRQRVQKLALGLRKLGHLSVSHIDKFPRLVDYVVPAGVRVGDGDACVWARI